MPRIVMYGAADCDDTARTRAYLHAQAIAFEYINIDEHADAEQFVIFINNGFRSTPTLVIGEGKRRIILTEPADDELAGELAS
ncbi:MAG: glutaredoxin [Anaerolineales bacterium]|nr:glutaredoxin [Anaerolineales bacterium]